MSEQDFFPLNEGAIVDCTEALKLDPKYANAFGVRADAKFRLGDNEGAIVDCTEALKVDPRCMKAFAVRAYAKLRLGDNEGAIVDCTEALKLDPKFGLVMHCCSERGNKQFKRLQTRHELRDYIKKVFCFWAP